MVPGLHMEAVSLIGCGYWDGTVYDVVCLFIG